MQRSIAAAFRSAAVAVLLTASPSVFAQAKPRIAKLDDLPRHTYAVAGSAAEVVTNAAVFQPIADKVRADILADLDKFQIDDKTTLKRLKGALLGLSQLADRDDETLALIAEIRALEDKPGLKLTTGVVTEARIEAKRKAGSATGDAFRAAFREALSRKVNALPWATVQNEIRELKGNIEIRSASLLLGIVASQIEPVVAANKGLGRELAEQLVSMRAALVVQLPMKDDILGVLETITLAKRIEKKDIWADRSVTLPAKAPLKNVVIAVWDSGVDTAVFKDRLFTNPTEKSNGRDDDNNGFIDDVNGIAFDLHANRVPELLVPLGDAAKRSGELKADMKGLLDLRASIDSPEASALKKKLAAIEPAKVKGFMEDLGLFGNYSHGTHVAGIAVAGNPFARILTARLTFDHRAIPEKPTVEQAHKNAAAAQATVDYFRAHNVRVVNMSWGGSLKDVEEALEANGAGKDAKDRASLAREIFQIEKLGLSKAIAGAPGILFIAAAGNSNNDAEFDEMIPSSIRLPNLITVAAVDKAGDQAPFTSFGPTVLGYANGYEVESYIPGGEKMKFSGTSMAAPQTANLAGKLFAIDPGLTPGETISLIRRGSDSAPTDPRIKLINPKRTVELLDERMAER